MVEPADDALGFELVDEALDCLAGEAHRAGDLRDRARLARDRDRAEHLPARGGESGAFAERVPGADERAVQSEDLQDELRERPAPGKRIGAADAGPGLRRLSHGADNVNTLTRCQYLEIGRAH